ncbi:phosphorylase [Clostridium grantii]|uniref:Uridine phosphorylase n=1 Tax=Clostridium grantii DSM 8605 TaxID=1121316 RepID=A0A1M5WWD3_9CLOT|nr:phosphorylase [Clostridium grantii]SHH91692.1 Uridine phosphorylase [Clostridium grantii DSM 8605]
MEYTKKGYSMEYRELLAGIERFGSTPEDMCQQAIGITIDKIKERVIIAPWWEPDVFINLGNEIIFLSDSYDSAVKVWNIKTDNFEVTYIKTGIGAPVLTDVLLALGLTACKRVLFIGSVGALDSKIGIGDIVIPEFSVCGDGVSRYLKGGVLNKNDVFGEKTYPEAQMFHALKSITQKFCEQNNIRWHIGRNFSIDTIFAQFAYIDEIVQMGCNTIEMETASAFRAATISNISLGALFSVSDNTMLNKSLYSGRTLDDIKYRKKVRKNIFPKIILEALE